MLNIRDIFLSYSPYLTLQLYYLDTVYSKGQLRKSGQSFDVNSRKIGLKSFLTTSLIYEFLPKN